jgi:hypothetical protein
VAQGPSPRAALLVFLLLASLSAGLALRAFLAPPAGTAFVGTFFYVDDFYNYLSYVEQAARGAFLFRNKLAAPAAPAALVNLEWLTVGWLAALAGGRARLAYRVFGLLALGAFVAVVDRWLVRSGLAPERRLPALLLVFTGGGLGGLLFAIGLLPGARALDLRTGAFPFVATLANPHFVAGTTLLLLGLGAYAAGKGGRGAVFGTVLGLVRPYDAALLAGVEGLVILLREPVAAWPRKLRPVLALLPVLAYDGWLFLGATGFRAFSSPRYAAESVSPADLAIALLPAALVAATAIRVPATAEHSAHRLRLLLWALLAAALVLLRPVSFATQFVVGLGVPLLVLGAVGLARRPRGALLAAVPALATTAAVATWLCTVPSPARDVPRERLRVAQALGPVCRPGDVVLAPPDIGLFVGGLSPCWPFVSHAAAPDHEARAESVRRFYGEDAPADRARLLETSGAAFVVLPARVPPGFLGAAPFAPRLQVGAGARALAVWARTGLAGTGEGP